MRNAEKIRLIISKLILIAGIYYAILFLNFIYKDFFRENEILYITIAILFTIKTFATIFNWLLICHPTTPKKPKLERDFTVDILTTYVKGEPKDMLIQTLLAIKAITYPHETFLCDEADDPELKTFCSAHNIHHVTRKIKVDAKAGNINNALRTVAKGEIVVILDPDHIPYKNFLDETLPFFQDEQIGFVQVVQAYYNNNNTLIAKAAAEQTYQYYGPVMMTLNSYGAAPAIGANCTFRRSALDSIGGHAPGLTEDMHTTIQLRAKGWKSVYNPVIVAKGLVPWNYSGFCLQQLKWSRGSFGLLFKVFPKLFKNLPWSQKLAFLSIPYFYIFGIIALIDFIIPITALICNISQSHLDTYQFIMRYIPFMFFSIIIHFYHQKWYREDHEKGTAFLGGVLFKSTWWATSLGFIYSLTKKKVPYIPTPKDSTVETPWKLLMPNLFIIIISIISIVYGLIIDLTPASIFMATLAFINILMLIIGSAIAMQKQIIFIKHLKPTIFLSKKIKIRKHFYKIRHYIYNNLSKSALATGFLTFIILSNILSSHIDINYWTKHFSPHKFIERLSYNLNINIHDDEANHWFYNKDYGQIYHGTSYTKNMDFYKNNGSFIKANFNLNKYNSLSINHFFDSCYINNTLPYVSLTINASNDLSSKNDSSVLTLEKLFKNIRKRCAPVILMFDRNSCHLSNSSYKTFYENASELADSLAIKDMITWVWHTTNLEDDIEFIKHLHKYRINVDWIYSEDEKAYFYKNQLFNKFYQDINTPLLVSEANIMNTQPTKKDYHSYIEHSIVGILDNKTNTPNKLIYNLQDIFKKPATKKVTRSKIPLYVKGVAYNPGEGGSNGQLMLTSKKLSNDFAMIKEMGCNTIRRFHPSIYDYNILRAAKKNNLHILYGFSFDIFTDYYKDSAQIDDYKQEVISTVKKYKTDSSIISYGLGNEVWNNLDKAYGQPYLAVVRNSYLNFIRELISELKSIDKHKPLFITEQQIPTGMHAVATYVPQIDFIGLNTYYNHRAKRMKSMAKNNLNDIPYLISEFGNDGYWLKNYTEYNVCEQLIEKTSFQKSKKYANIWNNYIIADRKNNLGGVAFCWQEKYEGTSTWFGLIDMFGNKKPAYYALKKAYTNESLNQKEKNFPIPDFKLSSIVEDNCKSIISANFTNNKNINAANYKYKWFVYEDNNFNLIEETDFEYGMTSFSFTLPHEYKKYRAYLYVTDNAGNVVTESTPISSKKLTLNYQKNELITQK